MILEEQGAKGAMVVRHHMLLVCCCQAKAVPCCAGMWGNKVVVQGKTYDASAKLEGRSMVMAPP